MNYTRLQLEALRLVSGSARNILLYGGSRSGKTFALCCALIVRSLKGAGGRHAVIRRHFNGVRTAVGMATLPKAFRLRFPELKYEFNRTECCFKLPNDSEIWLVGLDDAQRAEKILGREFSTLYFNECSELDFQSVQTALTRLAQSTPGIVNKALYDCNPPGRNHWSYRLFIEKIHPGDRTPLADPDDYAALRLNPDDNRENLPEGYIENTLAGLSARQRARFLHGEWLDDAEGALWKQEELERHRVSSAPELLRIVIGVDPAVNGGDSGDYIGIVAAGVDAGGDFYVLADRTRRCDPLSWCREVVALYRELEADRVVGEVNNGGDLIEGLLRQVDPHISFREVRATRGKAVRAEPVAALYEKGRVHHVGIFPELEEEMTNFNPLVSSRSPDRMDALVWAITELMRDGRRFVLA